MQAGKKDVRKGRSPVEKILLIRRAIDHGAAKTYLAGEVIEPMRVPDFKRDFSNYK